MNIAELLKIKTAAKAYLGGAAIAAQVALDYLPDHDNGYYKAVQGLVAVLSIIGIYAVPNKVAEAKQGTADIVAQVQALLAQIQLPVPGLPTIVTNTASVDPQKLASQLKSALTTAAPAPVDSPVAPAVEVPAPAATLAPAEAPAAPVDVPVATPIQKDTPTP